MKASADPAPDRLLGIGRKVFQAAEPEFPQVTIPQLVSTHYPVHVLRRELQVDTEPRHSHGVSIAAQGNPTLRVRYLLTVVLKGIQIFFARDEEARNPAPVRQESPASEANRE